MKFPFLESTRGVYISSLFPMHTKHASMKSMSYFKSVIEVIVSGKKIGTSSDGENVYHEFKHSN